jgi:hypothetical protein
MRSLRWRESPARRIGFPHAAKKLQKGCKKD